jgi:hypothetical protein
MFLLVSAVLSQYLQTSLVNISQIDFNQGISVECKEKISSETSLRDVCGTLHDNFPTLPVPNEQFCSQECANRIANIPCLKAEGSVQINGVATLMKINCLKNNDDYCMEKVIVPRLISCGYIPNNLTSFVTIFDKCMTLDFVCSNCWNKITATMLTAPYPAPLLVSLISDKQKKCTNNSK